MEYFVMICLIVNFHFSDSWKPWITKTYGFTNSWSQQTLTSIRLDMFVVCALMGLNSGKVRMDLEFLPPEMLSLFVEPGWFALHIISGSQNSGHTIHCNLCVFFMLYIGHLYFNNRSLSVVHLQNIIILGRNCSMLEFEFYNEFSTWLHRWSWKFHWNWC